MLCINGKKTREIEAVTVAAWAAGYPEAIVDVGTGDGRFVRHLARRCSSRAAIGIDACAANLRVCSRAAPANALFVVADALALPGELSHVATRVTVNFPWGSLLRGLLDGHPGLLTGLGGLTLGAATLEIRLNAGALAEAGWTLEAGSEQVAAVLRDAGATIGALQMIGPEELRRWPTTWAKRLAFGRDPRAVRIEAALG